MSNEKVMEKVMKKNVSTKWSKSVILLFSFLFIALLLILLSNKMTFLFAVNDDLFMRAIISGDLTGSPDAHAIFIYYPLAWLISSMYKLLPGIEWYGLFFVVIRVSCWWAILYRLTMLGSTRFRQSLLFILSVSGIVLLDMRELIFSQFTTVSGILAFTALLFFVTRNKDDMLYKYIIEILLLTLAFMIRYEMVIMYLPFFAIWVLIMLCISHNESKLWESIKKYVSLFLLLIFLLIVCQLIHNAFYQGSDWKEYNHFNSTRCEIYDYVSYPSYEGNELFYEGIGIDKDEMYIVKSINLGFDEKIDTNILQQILEKSNDFVSWNKQFYNVPRTVLFQYFDTLIASRIYHVLLYIFYTYIFTVAYLKREKKLVYQLILLLLTRSMLWIYLISRGRVLDRVTYPLILAELAILIGCIYINRDRIFHNNANVRINEWVGLGFISCFLMLFCLASYKTNLDQNREYILGLNWGPRVFSYIGEHSENNYLLEVQATNTMKIPMLGSGALYPDNAIYLGGWLNKSPIEIMHTDKKLGMSKERALVEEDNVYMIHFYHWSIDWIEKYLELIYDDVEVKIVDTINNEEGEPLFSVIAVKELGD